MRMIWVQCFFMRMFGFLAVFSYHSIPYVIDLFCFPKAYHKHGSNLLATLFVRGSYSLGFFMRMFGF
jgi:hypothetical protein